MGIFSSEARRILPAPPLLLRKISIVQTAHEAPRESLLLPGQGMLNVKICSSKDWAQRHHRFQLRFCAKSPETFGLRPPEGARRRPAAVLQLAPTGPKFHCRRFKTFDTSGKSPAYLHHRKNSKARAGKPAAGFFNPYFLNRTAAARHGATSSHAPLPEASQAGRRPSQFLNSAGTRERAGTWRGRSPRPHAASIAWR